MAARFFRPNLLQPCLVGILVGMSGRTAMPYRSLICAMSLFAVQCVAIVDAQAWDDARYPDLKGQWVRAEGARGVGRFDPTKPPGRLQDAPLTAEYQAIYE